MSIQDEIKKRRTFAIISHPDAGKTTITEQLLYFGGEIREAGTVKGKKTGNFAKSDWMDIEKQRGISVTSSVMQFDYAGKRVNILDTPGHEDFSEDTYRTLMAVDAAVMVVDSAKGIEAQTKKLFEVVKHRGIPVFTFMNKLDRDGREPLDLLEELEEVLVMADLGIHTTENIIEELKRKVKEQHIKEPQACKQLLADTIKEQMRVDEEAYRFEHQTSVVLVIGVNGVGKTTTIGKLAGQYKKAGKKVVLAAADTFRAAAIEQLTEWAHRAGVDIIAGQEGSDPASVIYDAIAAAKARKADILLCDTAGRLHNKKNLMEELKKINRIIEREYPEAYRENLIVLDGTTGQNALVQAKQFKETADITGIVLTKLDGTAKGGIAIAIQAELGVPVKYIGIGEKIEDLQKFDTDAFVDALFTPAEEN